MEYLLIREKEDYPVFSIDVHNHTTCQKILLCNLLHTQDVGTPSPTKLEEFLNVVSGSCRKIQTAPLMISHEPVFL